MKVMFSSPPAPPPPRPHQHHLQLIGKLCETRRMNSFPFSSLLLTLIKHMFIQSDVCFLRSRPCVRNVWASTFTQLISEAITDVNSFPHRNPSTCIGFWALATGRRRFDSCLVSSRTFWCILTSSRSLRLSSLISSAAEKFRLIDSVWCCMTKEQSQFHYETK